MKSILLMGLLLFAGIVLADDIKVLGSVDELIKNRQGIFKNKHIKLLNIELSAHAADKIDQRLAVTLNTDPPSNAFERVQLGMSNLPVLDQGLHGSCVVFATTAAVDAALFKRDEISQLCLLQLGQYLEEYGYSPSGWDGALGQSMLAKLDIFGLVSKSQQAAHGCGGVFEYSLTADAPTAGMSIEEYHKLSTPIDGERVGWSVLIDPWHVLRDKTNLDRVLDQVKTELKRGNRLTMGFLLPSAADGVVGAQGGYHVQNDSWVLTSEIAEEGVHQTHFFGHEIIITGFDDYAIAVDALGEKHKGLLTLRNSWGIGAGFQGDFYMSYDYFKAFVIEVMVIKDLTAISKAQAA